MQENHVTLLRVGALVVLALSAAAYVAVYAKSIDQTYPTRTFSVEGTGDIDTVPNVAQFSVTVITEGGRDVVDAQTKNTEKMNRINAFLKEKGIEAKDLKTTQYNVYPRYVPCTTERCMDVTIAGYSLNQTLEVKVRDTTKVGELLSGVVENGANNVSDVRFVVDDSSDAKDAARAEAIAEAKMKAEDMAKAVGFRLGKLISFYESGDAPMPYDYGMGGEASMNVKRAAPAIEPGSQNTKVTMTLTYEIVQ